MKKLVVASNLLNEIDQLPEWFKFVQEIADAGILIVDSGSDDGTIEFCQKQSNTVVVVDDIIRREGYGPARNHLRMLSRQHYPEAGWMIYLDADERIDEEEFHKLRHLKDYLIEAYDVIALPRIDWWDKEKTKAAKDWVAHPDWQARMSRLTSLNIKYLRKLHEQISGYKRIYTDLSIPKINHFHRSAGQGKRDYVGKLCAKLHMEDKQFGHTYPEHHKEAEYREKYQREGL